MANPASFTIQTLTKDAAGASYQGAQNVDTTGTVSTDAIPGGATDLLLILCENAAGQDCDVVVKAGDNPPAITAGKGDLTTTVTATSGKKIIGPFSPARFLQDTGKLDITFTPVSGSPTMAVRVYQIKPHPVVS